MKIIMFSVIAIVGLLSTQVWGETPLCAIKPSKPSSEVFQKRPELYELLRDELIRQHPPLSSMEVLYDNSYAEDGGIFRASIIYTEALNEIEFQRVKAICTFSISKPRWDCPIVSPYSNFVYKGRVVYFQGLSAIEARNTIDAFGALPFAVLADVYPGAYSMPVESFGCIGSVTKTDGKLHVKLGGDYGSQTFQLVKEECREGDCDFRVVYTGSSNPG